MLYNAFQSVTHPESVPWERLHPM